MKILYNCTVEMDLQTGHSLHTRYLCEELALAGHEVTIVAPNCQYAAAGVAASTDGALRIEGIPFLGYSRARLHLYRWLLQRRLVGLVREVRPDVIVDKLSLSLRECVTAAVRTELPLVIELNGELNGQGEEQMVRAGLHSTGRLPEVGLLGVSPGLDPCYGPLLSHVPAEFHHFENGVKIGAPEGSNSARTRSSLGVPEDAFVVGYVGAPNLDYDFETLMQGSRLAIRRGLDVHFLIVGPRALREHVTRLAAVAGLESRVTLVDTVPHAEVGSYLDLFDCGMVLWKSEYAHMGPTALKLKEMLYAGVPCLVNRTPDWVDWPLAGAARGLLEVSPEAVSARLLEIALGGPDVELAGAATLIRDKYSWRHAAGEYATRLAQYVENRGRRQRARESACLASIVS